MSEDYTGHLISTPEIVNNDIKLSKLLEIKNFKKLNIWNDIKLILRGPMS